MKSILLSLLLTVAASAEPVLTYYLVEGTMLVSGGRKAGTLVSLVKRTVDRDQSRIEERVITMRGTDPAREIVTVMKVEGSRFKMIADEAFEGEGELIGEPWRWPGLKFTARLNQSGQVVRGEDQYTDTGISAEKQILGPDGKLIVTIRELGSAISQPTYELLRARLLK